MAFQQITDTKSDLVILLCVDGRFSAEPSYNMLEEGAIEDGVSEYHRITLGVSDLLEFLQTPTPCENATLVIQALGDGITAHCSLNVLGVLLRVCHIPIERRDSLMELPRQSILNTSGIGFKAEFDSHVFSEHCVGLSRRCSKRYPTGDNWLLDKASLKISVCMDNEYRKELTAVIPVKKVIKTPRKSGRICPHKFDLDQLLRFTGDEVAHWSTNGQMTIGIGGGYLVVEYKTNTEQLKLFMAAKCLFQPEEIDDSFRRLMESAVPLTLGPSDLKDVIMCQED